MSKESQAERPEAGPTVTISPENMQAMQNAARTLAETLPQIGKKMAEEFAAHEKFRAEIEDRIKRGGRQTSGRIKL